MLRLASASKMARDRSLHDGLARVGRDTVPTRAPIAAALLSLALACALYEALPAHTAATETSGTLSWLHGQSG